MSDQQTEAYRRSTIALTSAATLYAIQQLQQAQDIDTFFDSILGVVNRASAGVVNLARNDFYATRRAAGVRGPDPTWQPRPLQPEALRASLYATAGQTLQRVEKFDLPLGGALKRAQTQVAGVVTRQVMNSARNSTIATTKQDREAIGALYITRGDDKVCYWCGMLASRGPVFGSDSFVDSDAQFVGTGTAKSHDHCRCVVKVVYSEDTPLLDESHRLEELWRDINWAEGWRDMDRTVPHIRNRGKTALNEWRRVWEGRHPTISMQ